MQELFFFNKNSNYSNFYYFRLDADGKVLTPEEIMYRVSMM